MKRVIFVILFLVSVSAAQADIVSWTNWTSETASAPGVLGTLNVGSSTVGVSFSGAYSFAQINGGGTNYWVPSTPYISYTVSNAPATPDIIALNDGGTKTITFSQPVHDPLLALVSWNGNIVDFGVPIKILSYGGGYWGNGTPFLNATGTGFYGDGDVNGVIELPGTYSSISFTDVSENWHGLTVGVNPSTVPEPFTMLLLGSGLVGLAGVRKYKK